METECYFKKLCELYEKIENTSSRLEIIDHLSTYMKIFTPKNKNEMISFLYLSTAEIFPAHMNREINIGESIILNILSEMSSMRLLNVKNKYKETGDFGIIAYKFSSKPIFSIKFKPCSISEIHRKLIEVVDIEGKDAKKQKLKILLSTIRKLSPIERKYFIRILDGKLKIGLALQTLLIALGIFFGHYYNEEGDFGEDVKTAYNRLPIFEELISLLFSHNIKELLDRCLVQLGIPLRPMLAQPVKSFEDISKKLEGENFFCEYKYDGERIQIHKYGNEFKAFSRNGLNLLLKYPDIEKYVMTICEDDFIIDCEIVAYDYAANKILPFQILSTRKRKMDRGEKSEIDIQLIIFDILFLKKSDCLNYFFEERREILHKNFNLSEKIRFAKSKYFSSIDNVEEFFNCAIKDNAEGLMIKKTGPGSFYMPSKRTHNWIKLKKDYLNTTGDTFDLVVIGVYMGKGKRTSYYGGFLMGAYNEKRMIFESVCKLGTGFKEDDLKKIYEKIEPLRINEKPKNCDVDKSIIPDYWIAPHIIWEVKAAELTLSPIYSCSKNMNKNRGISMRFPRFIKERDDRSINDMTTSEFIYGLMNNEEDGDDFISSSELDE